MQYGMIGYYVPHKVYPKGYHCDPTQPLPFAALASQKNHMALYLMPVYCGCAPGSPAANRAGSLREAWAKTGKKWTGARPASVSRDSTTFLWI